MSESKKGRTELPVVPGQGAPTADAGAPAAPTRAAPDPAHSAHAHPAHAPVPSHLRTPGPVPPPSVPAPLDRREVLKLLALAAAAPAALSASACAPGEESATGAAGDTATTPRSATASNPLARGDAWDPDLVNPVLRWEKVLTQDERDGLAVLCDVILPADGRSPAASTVGAHDYIDEWVSAPYDFGRRDLVLVRGGLVWLDNESAERFGAGRRFRDLTPEEQRAICDDICYLPRAAPEHRMGARFFAKVRDLAATAYYTTPEGMEDIGYVGNLPTTDWPGPPPEVLRHIGLEGA